MVTHENALNAILANNCPNGNEPNAEETGIYSWVFYGHCHTIRIKAKLVSKDPDNLIEHERFKYEILSVSVVDGGY